jgi:hypothetical protein
MKRLIIAAAVVSLFSSYTQAQTMVINGEKSQVGPVKSTQPTFGMTSIPDWYLQTPESTGESMYFSGTAVSSDLAMSREKALLDAQIKLADSLNGTANALVKHFKADNAGDVYSDKTQMTVKKVITDTKITGYRVENSLIVPEKQGYRCFVLIRYPVGDTNTVRRDQRTQPQTRMNDVKEEEDSQRELDQEIKNQRKVSNNDTFIPADQVALVKTNNDAYIQARDEALKKPGAVVLQQTFN